MSFDLRGSLKRFALPEILQLIASGSRTGTLGIQKDDNMVMVYFEDGSITYGYGPRQTYHIGQLLKERGVLSAEALEEAVRIQADEENSKRLGEILVARGMIDRADLKAAVKDQIEQLLYSLLSWDSGTFKFYEGQLPTEEEIKVEISVENVILEGLRRHDEMNLVRDTLPDQKEIFRIAVTKGDRSRDVNMSADEWNMMASVDGRRSLKDICNQSDLGEERTLLALARLKLSGLIVPMEAQPAESTDNLEAMVGRLAGLFEQYLTAKSVDSRITRNVTRDLVENSD